MKLRFHNQLTRQVDTFKPSKEGFVSLYTCGPTVYNFLTVGNWSAYVYWDTLVRVLEDAGLAVTRVMNITDVGHLVSDADEGEDKLEKGARREGKTAWDVAAFYTEDFIQGMHALHMREPSHFPKATDYIEAQLALVATLKEKGYTYEIDDGIYYDTSRFSSYDDFAELHIAAQQASARVAPNPQKRNASDFALWKFTQPGETRDMQWPTPNAILDSTTTTERYGFPGWHLECSAMAMALLGPTIDIHTGGIDHIPVHHTNEIAQSEAATGQQLAHYWLHANHLKVEGTKISKSLGNGYTLQDITAKGYEPLDLRLFILQSHYRTEGNFSFANLAAARNRRNKWRSLAALRHQTHDTLQATERVEGQSSTGLYAAAGAVREALYDDLNTPAAFAHIDEALNELDHTPLAAVHRHSLITFFETLDALLGLDLLGSTPDISDDQKQRIIERNRARDAKDFAASDTLRHDLEVQGIILRDTASGVVWEYAA